MRVDSSETLAADPGVERLLAIARRKGSVGFEDIRQQLPIARMSALEIAQAVARLERAGIVIDVDQDPLLDPSDARVTPDRSAAAPAESTASARPEQTARSGAALVGTASSPNRLGSRPVFLSAALAAGMLLLVLLGVAALAF